MAPDRVTDRTSSPSPSGTNGAPRSGPGRHPVTSPTTEVSLAPDSYSPQGGADAEGQTSNASELLVKSPRHLHTSGNHVAAANGDRDLFPRAAVEQTIGARFEEISRRHPDRLALQTGTHRSSYEELNRAANRISRSVLDRRGGGSEPIAVLMERSTPQIASVIALAKAGKIFVPLDASFPETRLAKVLEDCQPRLVLTSTGCQTLASRLRGQPREVLNVETIDPGSSAEDPGLTFSPDTLAYILYTSGSTGQPKGVAYSHFGLLHQIRRHTIALRIGVEDRVTMLGSASAAQANTQLHVALLNGAALFPKDLKQDGLADLAAWLTRERITYYRSSASTFRHWARHLSASELCPTLRLLAVGGEPVYRQDFELYRSHFLPECLLVNALSTTETARKRPVPVSAARPGEPRCGGRAVLERGDATEDPPSAAVAPVGIHRECAVRRQDSLSGRRFRPLAAACACGGKGQLGPRADRRRHRPVPHPAPRLRRSAPGLSPRPDQRPNRSVS